jgi:hypothetical protein
VSLVRQRAVVVVVAATVVVAAGAAACGDASRHAAARGVSAAAIKALSLRERALPALRIRHFVTSGRYPQIAGGQANLSNVNAALLRAVLTDQKRVARLSVPGVGGPGLYMVAPQLRWISASSAVVSVLLPETAHLPRGSGDDQSWIAATVRVPSGAAVSLSELFDRPSLALRELAASASKNACIAIASAAEGSGYTANPAWSPPRLSGYPFFALTPRGLVLGFAQGVAAGVGCGRLEVTIPYETLRPYLSPLGQALVDAVRRPVTR